MGIETKVSDAPLSKSRFGDDPLGYYNEHYPGMPRGRLHKEDSRLYQILNKEGLLDKIPLADRSAIKRRSSRFGDDSLGYYKEHYSGMTRGRLQEEDPGMYNRLRKDCLLDEVPLANRSTITIKRRSSKFGGDPVKYYNEHYPGMTRGRLQKEDNRLYNRLWEDGLLDEVPLAVRRRYSKFGGDPVKYYNEHYSGMTRTNLSKNNPGLYKQLSRKKLLDEVPKAVRGAIKRRSSKFGDDPVKYYKAHYPGMTRKELYNKNLSLYQMLSRKGRLDEVPKAK